MPAKRAADRFCCKRKGSLSLETALVLPPLLLLMVIFSLALRLEQQKLYLMDALDRVAAEYAGMLPLTPPIKNDDETFATILDDYVLQQADFSGSDLVAGLLTDSYLRARLKNQLEKVNPQKGMAIWKRIDSSLRLEQTLDLKNKVRWLLIYYEQSIFSFRFKTNLRSVVPIWNEVQLPIETEAAEIDQIWLLDNLTRGQKHREVMGSNLPFDFPVIARWGGGQAVLMHSMDLTAPTYQSKSEIERAIVEKIDKLAHFTQADYRREDESIRILPGEIQSRQLWLIIPQNAPDTSVSFLQDFLEPIARQREIDLIIRPYGNSYRYQPA